MSPALYLGSMWKSPSDDDGEAIFIAAGGGGVFVRGGVEVGVGDEFAGVGPGDDGDLADVGFLGGGVGGKRGRGVVVAEKIVNGDAEFFGEVAEFFGAGGRSGNFPSCRWR